MPIDHLLSRRRVLALTGAALALPSSAQAEALKPDAVLALLRVPGHVAFMRHAWAPFEGAPKGERGLDADDLGPCETQRNLDDFGRNDARRIGALFRDKGIVFEHVFTSKWCRCRETADLIMGRPVENLPLINSYYSSPRKDVKAPEQLAGLRAYLNRTLKPTDRALLVTHGSLITDLCRIDTGESEMVIVKADGRGDLVVVGHGVV